jgi:hypothetical protein
METRFEDGESDIAFQHQHLEQNPAQVEPAARAERCEPAWNNCQTANG